jgi:hypothetical protein
LRSGPADYCVIVMVADMVEWILQMSAYVPAALNVRLPVVPGCKMSVVHAGSSFNVAVCGSASLSVQVIVSPTLAVIAAGTNAVPAIPAWTVPAVADGVQAAPPAAGAEADAAGAEADAAGSDAAGTDAAGTDAAGAALGAVEAAGEQAARDRMAAMARVGMSRRDMASSRVRKDLVGAFSSIYVATSEPVWAGPVT